MSAIYNSDSRAGGIGAFISRQAGTGNTHHVTTGKTMGASSGHADSRQRTGGAAAWTSLNAENWNRRHRTKICGDTARGRAHWSHWNGETETFIVFSVSTRTAYAGNSPGTVIVQRNGATDGDRIAGSPPLRRRISRC